jgi:DNA-binding HxlR family transcriptional regulator
MCYDESTGVIAMGYNQMCPRYESAIELLGKKWTALLLRILLDGPKRFSEFKLQVPDLSDRLLSERLQELEESGVIVREVHNTRPVLVEYRLTPKGEALKPVVDAIQQWAEAWCDAN